jgi:HEAT repeat protein
MIRHYRHVFSSVLLAAAVLAAAGCSSQSAAIKPIVVTPTPIYQAVAKRDFGTESAALDAVAAQIHDATPTQYPPIEAQLLWVIENPTATMPGKQFACQQLKIVGSHECIGPVSVLLTDEKLSHSARNVLLGMKDPAVDKALRNALAKTEGKTRIGIINTIGDRSEQSVIPTLAALVKSDDATASAALNAIGKIGGTQAAYALDRVKVPDSLTEAWASAYLRCAGSLTTTWHADLATKMYQKLFNGSYPSAIRAGAMTALAQIEKEKLVPEIVKLLTSDDSVMQRAAGDAAVHAPGNATTRALAKALAEADPAGKMALLVALSARGDAAGVAEQINALAAETNPDADVRQAAIVALSTLGDASSVSVLANAFKTPGPISTAAKATLIELDGPHVGDAIVMQAQTGAPEVRQAVFNVLVERHQTDVLPAARVAAKDADPAVRRAAFKTLGALGEPKDFTMLLPMLLADPDSAEQDAIADAMSNIARHSDRGPLADPVVKALPTASADAKIRLLAVLSVLGGDNALKAVRDSLATAEGPVRRSVVRVLSNWVDAAPMPDLLVIAKDDKDSGNRILALQGYIRMAGLLPDDKKKLDAYGQANTLATRTDEKRLVIAGLSDVGSVEALAMVEPYFANNDLRHEAYTAYEKIAELLAKHGNTASAAKAALARVAAGAPDRGLRERAAKAAAKIK